MWTSRKEVLQLKNKIASLEITLKQKESQLLELEKLRTVLFVLDESIPEGETLRKKYVSDIAFFYGTVFQEKLKHFIGMQMEELSQVGRSEEMYAIIRSNINCFRLIDEWCDKMTKEHFGNLEALRQQASGQDDFINKMKQEYNI